MINCPKSKPVYFFSFMKYLSDTSSKFLTVDTETQVWTMLLKSVNKIL